MESVGTETGLIVVSSVIQLIVLGAILFGLYKLFRAARTRPALRASLYIGLLFLIVVIIIAYGYLGALGRGMSL